MQTYASICILLAEKRPKRLMMQAGVLGPSLFENLATVLTLTENPNERTQILMRESIRMFAEKYMSELARHSNDPKWKSVPTDADE